MKLFQLSLILVLSGILLVSCSSKANESKSQAAEESILIFSKTEEYRHASIPDGIKAIEEIASQEEISTTHTEDSAYFESDSLAQFDMVLFLSTTGDVLNDQQQKDFRHFVQNGGGFMGIHAASDTEYDWPWYGQMVGAYFESHPEIQEATITVMNKDHPSTSFLPDEWIRTDEWYNFNYVNSDVNVLMNLEESTYSGGEHGDHHPIAWYHEYEGSTIFYTALGHTAESYSDELFRRHLRGGIKYVLGH